MCEMNDVQLLEEKVNICKKRVTLLCCFFLLAMLIVGAYISNLPYQLAIFALAVLFVLFALIVWNSIKIRKLKREIELEDSDMIKWNYSDFIWYSQMDKLLYLSFYGWFFPKVHF